MIRGYLSVVFFLTILSALSQSRDSLVSILENATGRDRVVLLHRLVDQSGSDHRREAYTYAKQSLELSVKLGEKDLHVNSLYQMAVVSEKLGNYPDAIDYGKEALSQAKDPITVSDINHQLGIIYESLSEYETSLSYHLTALSLREQLEDAKRISNSYNSIAFVYRGMRQYEKALEILRKMKQLALDLDDRQGLSRATFNEGLMVLEMDRHAEAIPIFREAMRDVNESENPHIFSSYYNNLANCFERLLHVNAAFYDSALYYGKKSLELKYETGNVRGIANTHNTLAAIYERASDYQNSHKMAKEALRIADSLNLLRIKRNALAYLITAEIKMEMLDHVNDHFEDYRLVEEEISDQANSRVLSEMTTKFETNKKIAENTLLKAEARNQKLITILLLCGGIVLLLVCGLLYYLYRLKQKNNQQLTADKEMIEAQSKKLQELNNLKSHFFANISHELRTPLTLIQGNADAIIAAPKVTPVAVEPARKIKRNVKQMSLLVNDLLDLSKLELNKKLVNLRPTPINKVVTRVAVAFSSLADSNQIKLSYESILSDDVLAALDEIQFEKVLNNLIYNAFKFTASEGVITINSTFVPGGVEIAVSDNGAGIEQKDLPYIFDRFYQAPMDPSKAGSGLGLAISKELVELMDGQISVTSERGEGTTVTILIPVIESDVQLEGSHEVNELYQNGEIAEVKFDLLKIPSDTSVLIVEDNVLLQNYLASILSDHFELYRAGNGQEALELLDKFRPDLILTDVMMPVMDGWEFMERLRADRYLSKIPVIALTAVAENEDRLRGLRLGVDDYIIKPFEVEELLIRITNVINNLRERIKWAREFAEDEAVPSDEQHDLAIAIRDFVKDHVSDGQLNVSQIALHLGLSERQLYRKTAESLGMSPSKVILEVRLQYARELLVSNRYAKLAQIAGEVGFESPSYFSKVYLERFGKKPSDYFS